MEIYYRLPPDWRRTATGYVCCDCIRLRRQALYRPHPPLVDPREPADMKAAVLELMKRRGPVATKVIAKKLHAKLPALQMLLSEMRQDGLVRLVPKKYYILERKAI